jgi:hypothetical protein
MNKSLRRKRSVVSIYVLKMEKTGPTFVETFKMTKEKPNAISSTGRRGRFGQILKNESFEVSCRSPESSRT